jgi:DNA-binding NtrC family response regulator
MVVGNRSAAARLLGISRDTMRYRLEKFGLDGEAQRHGAEEGKPSTGSGS